MRAWAPALWAITFAGLLAGCASVYNLPGNVPLGAALADNNFGREVPNSDDDLLLALSFSGGGTRAAAFSFGVLTELDRSHAGSDQAKSLLDRVDCAKIKRWRCGLSAADRSRLGVGKNWRCGDVSFAIDRISFDQLGPARAGILNAVPTRFSLPADQVDLLIEGGADALRLSKAYQAFRRGL